MKPAVGEVLYGVDLGANMDGFDGWWPCLEKKLMNRKMRVLEETRKSRAATGIPCRFLTQHKNPLKWSKRRAGDRGWELEEPDEHTLFS